MEISPNEAAARVFDALVGLPQYEDKNDRGQYRRQVWMDMDTDVVLGLKQFFNLTGMAQLSPTIQDFKKNTVLFVRSKIFDYHLLSTMYTLSRDDQGQMQWDVQYVFELPLHCAHYGCECVPRQQLQRIDRHGGPISNFQLIREQ